LTSRRLPDFTFIGDDGAEQRVAFASEVPRIRAVATALEERVAGGTCVGLVYRSSPELVRNWLACLLAGLRPLIMQYPTKKQTRAYWADSVSNTIAVAAVGAVIADEFCAGILRETDIEAPVIAQNDLAALADGNDEPFALETFSIIQLSSGTTGYRKAIEFSAEQLFAHVTDYNATLQLGPSDTIVSWLPLYHDMGYIACFVMPMILGIDVVMMDPMTWIRQPELLFDAIERHSGTVCYLPNFGFEVMARLSPRRLPSMRWWVSCSEPVSHQTARKFIAVTQADPDTFAPCYAMAENVFAVSLCRGLATCEIDEAEVVSCGGPIANVDIKEVDGQIWVRSPASLRAYIGGEDIRDADGFYPTGDLGRIIDGQLYITGRKQDLLIQAGRKFMLSDIDLALNRLFPWIRGRAAAVQTYDTRLGTQKPLVLIETEDFFLRRDHAEIASALRDAVGLDQVGVEFVPPRFLTKTSSGKFNRKKSAADWILAERMRERRGGATDPLAELKETFGSVDWSTPVKDILDSLSLELLRIILTGTPVRYNADQTLSDIAAELAVSAMAQIDDTSKAIRIVSLADRGNFRHLQESDLEHLSALLGAPVTFEHICLPPSPILLSDLIFHDYFQGRAENGNFTAVDNAFATLRAASAILVDDVAEMMVGGLQVYGALSHNLERDPGCDLISFRWQRYPKFHDTLPLTLVAGQDLAFSDRSGVIDMLEAYLATPILRMASVEGLESFTKDWNFRSDRGTGAPIDVKDFVSAFAAWAKDRPAPLKLHPFAGGDTLQMNDLAHFCSHLVARPLADMAISKFDRFCIAGQRSSVPYVRKELERQNKSYVYAASYAPEILNKVAEDYDCVVICGPQGEYEIEGPAVALMRASGGWLVQGIDDPDMAQKGLKVPGWKVPESGSDWFYPFALRRGGDQRALADARALRKENLANQVERTSYKQERAQKRKQRDLRRAELSGRRHQRAEMFEQSGPDERRARRASRDGLSGPNGKQDRKQQVADVREQRRARRAGQKALPGADERNLVEQRAKAREQRRARRATRAGLTNDEQRPDKDVANARSARRAKRDGLSRRKREREEEVDQPRAQQAKRLEEQQARRTKRDELLKRRSERQERLANRQDTQSDAG
jgi:acyl-CoA synthetase (AMP-forming)/AMP-acid ligase II